MSFKITMNRVASYQDATVFASDKKVTLLYGLNGTGKSTLSNFLYSPTDRKFAACSTEGVGDAHVYVYNAKFVRDHFYEIDKLNGIFTLSKINREVEEEIKNKTLLLADLDSKEAALAAEAEEKSNRFHLKRAAAEDAVWEIKKRYSGGDRVLEYCLKGMMKSKEALFDCLSGVALPTEAPTKTIEILKQEVEAIQGDNAKGYPTIPEVEVLGADIEENQIFSQAIVGNQDSPIASLIKKLGNGDWVSQGLPFVEKLHTEGDETCPFCQAKTLSEAVAYSIKSYFDETFEAQLQILRRLKLDYSALIKTESLFEPYADNPFYMARKSEVEALYGRVVSIWKANEEAIERKMKGPSASVTLNDSGSAIAALNSVIREINSAILVHNQKIDNRVSALSQIKSDFWTICRWEYRAVIDVCEADADAFRTEQKELLERTNKYSSDKQRLRNELAELQKKTVNIEQAINVINSRLVDLGIDSFHIIKAAENRYKVSRNGTEGEDFLTLSEGEKTVISFLYFVELCKGKKSATQIGDRKIVVIDDPISSLSHLYVFNIGEIIKAEFCNSEKFEHVIVMTHSLYFFYELTETKQEMREKKQTLLRLIKNSAGSKIVEMKYEEIQNDYQAYWNIVMDEGQHPAIIANCMRNIIEYFFNFVKNMPLSNVFQQRIFRDPKHLAFYRFMNRESHSLGQNIFDHKEFDYARFRECFKLIFEEAGFHEHYRAMAKGR